MIVFSPRKSRSPCSICSFDIVGFRFKFSKHCSVVMRVPSQSTKNDPASSTNGASKRRIPRWLATWRGTWASLSYGRNRSPHELNRK